MHLTTGNEVPWPVLLSPDVVRAAFDGIFPAAILESLQRRPIPLDSRKQWEMIAGIS